MQIGFLWIKPHYKPYKQDYKQHDENTLYLSEVSESGLLRYLRINVVRHQHTLVAMGLCLYDSYVCVKLWPM